jgi:hypothetical protein
MVLLFACNKTKQNDKYIQYAKNIKYFVYEITTDFLPEKYSCNLESIIIDSTNFDICFDNKFKIVRQLLKEKKIKYFRLDKKMVTIMFEIDSNVFTTTYTSILYTKNGDLPKNINFNLKKMHKLEPNWYYLIHEESTF